MNRRLLPSSSAKSIPRNGAPTFSVIVCTHNRPNELERCLEGVSRQKYQYFEILVIDSVPQDALAFEIARHRGLGYIVEPVPGLSRARNIGVRASTGEIIAFLDDDAVPDPDWLQNLAAQFKDPKVAVVTGRIKELQAPGEPASKVSEFYSLDCLGDERRTVDRENPQWFEIAGFGGAGLGSNMAFRRSAFLSWHGFDHRLGRGTRISGCEEHFAFLSLVDLGLQVVYTPDAVVYHPYPADLGVLRGNHLRNLAAHSGYVAFLFFEMPQHRRQLVRYVFEALRGVRRTWRASSPRFPVGLISRGRRYRAMLQGPFLYLRTQFSTVPRLVPAPALSEQLSTSKMPENDEAAVGSMFTS